MRAVIRLITPPLPAVSRPSKTTMTRAFLAWTQAAGGKLDLELRELLLEFLALILSEAAWLLGCLVLLRAVLFEWKILQHAALGKACATPCSERTLEQEIASPWRDVTCTSVSDDLYSGRRRIPGSEGVL